MREEKQIHPVKIYFTRLAVAVLISFILLLTFAPRAHAITWSGELLTNPGFETGGASGWSNGGGGSVNTGLQCTYCDNGPHSGSYQAYWESSDSTYYLYQTVDLSSYASGIDAGLAVVNATGWLIANEDGWDQFNMQVRFYDGASAEMVAYRYDTGPLTVTTWAQYGIQGYPVPSGARSIQIRFNTWEDGWDAGSADDFSVEVGVYSATDIRRLDTNWHTGLTGYTAPAGSNRLLVFITGFEDNAADDVTSVTYGGQLMQEAVGYITTAVGYVARCEIWFLKDANIPAGSNNFVVTYNSGTAPLIALHGAATYANVDQTDPVYLDTAQNEDSVAPIDNPIQATVNVVAGGMAIAGAAAGNANSYSWGNGWSEGPEQQDTGNGFTLSTAEHASAADGTDTASATHGNPNRQVIVVASLAPAAAGTAQYDQDSFRARNDNGGETSATWTAAANINWTQMVDKNFRLRFLVQETAGASDSGKTFQLQYNRNSGGWNNVTGSSSVVKASATVNVTDGVDTTQQLGSGSYVSTNAGFDEANGQVGAMDFTGNDEVELEFCIQIVGSDVSNGDTIELRILGLDTYTNTPTITVTGAGTFLYKKSIEIQESEVTCTSNVNNFPVMVQLTGVDFLEVADDVDSDRFDIIFKAEDDATCGGAGVAPCILDHEIEEYDETTNNRLVAWVRIPVLDFDNNTTIYLYYGNSAVAAATENPTGVWDSNYKGVWHLHDDLLDSTSNENDGTDSGGSTNGTGQMADGQTFDGNNDYIYTTNLFNDPQEFTISAWFRTSSASGRKIVGFESDQTGTGSVNWDRHLYVGTDGYVYFGAYDGDPVDVAVSTNTLNDNLWHHVVGVRDDTTNNLYLYVDGNYNDTTANTFAEAGTGYWRIGSYKTTGWTNGVDGYFPGTVDEVRISLTARPLCWIQTEHSNQDDPATFIGIGPEVTTSPNAAVSGTITLSTTESDIVSGGKTIIITLSNDTWVAAGATFDAQRQNIIDGLNSAQSETNGWNNEVRDKQTVSGVVRTSNTVVTITLDAQAGYDLSANETITVTVPASALVTSSSPLVADPTFDVSYVSTSPLTLTHYRWRNDDGEEAASAGWWNSSYLYRKKVTFGTSHSLLPVGYTVAATMDTRPANTNVELTTGNDVRVVWQPTAGGAVELDRIGDAWDNATTNIEFRLQSEIDANLDEDTDGSYYIYYSNVSAGTPPRNEMNVYYFADFFSRANSTTVGNGWTEWNVNAYDAEIASNALHESGTNIGPADAGVKQNFSLGSITGDFTLTVDWTIPVNSEGIWTNYIQIGDNMANNSRTSGVAMGLFSGESNGLGTNYGIDENMDNNLIDTGISGSHSFKLVVDYANKRFDYYIDDFVTPHTTGVNFIGPATALNQIRMANDQYSAGQPDFVWDNLKIVLNVADVPEETLDSEEAYQASGATWAENEDTPLTGLAPDTIIRVRFLVSNEGGVTSGPVQYQLQFAETSNCGSGSYSAVPVTPGDDDHWQIVDSSYITNGGGTSNIDPGLTDPGGGSFVPGQVMDAANTTGDITLDTARFTEIEFAIKTYDVPGGGDYCFRLYDTTNGVALGPSTAYAQVSLVSGVFSYRKPITIPAGSVGGTCTSYLEEFPLLVKITDPDLIDNARDDAYDIVFRGLDDYVCGGVDTAPCGLWHEVERWNSATGELIAWVRVPRIYHDQPTTVYMYYGNPGVTQASENPGKVWENNNYVVVQHMDGASYTALDDSTANYNDVTTEVSDPVYQADGHIGYAVEFDGNDAVEISDPGAGSSLDITTQVTVSAWISPTAIGQWNRIVAKSHTVNDTPWTMYGLLFDNASHIREEIASGGAQSGANGTSVVPTDGSWTFATVTYDHSALRVYFNGSAQGTPTNLTTDIDTNNMPLSIARSGFGADYFTGKIDEVRVSSIARGTCWIGTEYNNQSNPGDIGSPGFYTVGTEEATPATAVNLLSFTATGQGSFVLVEWETAQEIKNMGFNLYRATSPSGPFTKLNDKVIPGLGFSVRGKAYSYMDNNVVPGKLYYYKLQDMDTYGKKTFHGPICVDWDGDGIPDDWEIAHGLNPALNDAWMDLDGDGLTNLEEYKLGTDPLNPDTDGDGILDGQEAGKIDRGDTGEPSILTQGVQIVAFDENGITLELRTEAFEMEMIQVDDLVFQRLGIPEYIHGFTPEVGKPELPMKGVLLDVPDGKSATLTVEAVESKTLSGYWIYPVPQKIINGEEGSAHVAEVFTMDEAAYSTDAFYPEGVVSLGQTFMFRDQQKLQVRFYPLAFNSATRELRHYNRIRVRVDYAGAAAARSFSRALALPVPSAPSPSPRALAWTPPSSGPVYKILVSDEGIYRITRTYLLNSGIPAAHVDGMRLNQVRVYNLGQEVAIHVYDQDGDNTLDDVDYVAFYGSPLGSQYVKYAKYNVYWLTDSGVAGGLRMAAIDGTPVSSPVSEHVSTIHHEEDTEYVTTAPGGDGQDRWFFSPIVLGPAYPPAWGGGQPASFSLFLPDVGGNKMGSLKIRMAGVTDENHGVEVSVNGTPALPFTWNGIAFHEVAIDSIGLVDGDNTIDVAITCTTDPSIADGILVDWFEMTYPKNFVAQSDVLKFSYGAGSAYQILGFGGSEILAFDITSAGDVRRILNAQTTDMGGSYRFDMEPLYGTGERTYLVLSMGVLKTPVDIYEVVDPKLSDSINGADYILITHRDLGWDGNGDAYSWLNDLVTLRQTQGLRVKAVDVSGIYNEFSYGIVSPQGIKDFLTHAYNNWTRPAPQYVLFVGDSTYDYKDNLGLGTVNFVPTYLSWTDYMGETLTDDWFAWVSGNDAVPDLYIGRLPASSVAEAAAMVSKIISYESTVNSKTWERNTLLVADDQTEEYEALFEIMSNEAAALIPTGMDSPFKEYLADYVNADALKATIKDRVNIEGTLIVNYSGHGYTQGWDNGHILENSDVADLSNSSKLPFFVSMTCLTGFFGYPEAWNYPSMAEVLLRSVKKGAVAAFMSTGMTASQGQRILDVALFDSIFKRDVRTLGPAISLAKQTLLSNGFEFLDVSKTFLLFGDPAMQLKVPLPTVPSGFMLEATTNGVVLSWQGATDCNGGEVSGYNVYRSMTPGGPYTMVNKEPITTMGYTDSFAQTGTWYYLVTSVDGNGDESVPTQELAVTAGARTLTPTLTTGGAGGAGGGGGCFINAIAN